MVYDAVDASNKYFGQAGISSVMGLFIVGLFFSGVGIIPAVALSVTLGATSGSVYKLYDSYKEFKKAAKWYDYTKAYNV